MGYRFFAMRLTATLDGGPRLGFSIFSALYAPFSFPSALTKPNVNSSASAISVNFCTRRKWRLSLSKIPSDPG
jgi:hypothetical protein